jgi:HD-GYP domain-containing protein (c-di-GMP phosphodiesterase class II)
VTERTGDPLLVHERSLTSKVAAGSEAGELVDEQLLQLGTQLVTQLNVLLRTVRSHGSANTALDRPLAALQTLVRSLGGDQPVTLRIQESFVFLGERHLPVTSQQLPIFVTFFDALASRGVGGITLRQEVSEEQLRRFAEIFASAEALGTLRAKLAAERIETIAVEPLRAARRQETEAPRGTQRGPDRRRETLERAKGAYGRAASALATTMQNVRSGGALHFRHARRAMQNIVDLLLRDPATVIGLTTLRAHDEYTQNHSVNVAVLAMALANRAGFPKVELAEVGLAALFHDLGKCAVPLEVLNKPGEFTPQEWDLMRTHPSEGVISLVRIRGLRNVPVRMVAAAFEHHLNFDGSGYPKVASGWKQTLSSRIVSIADCYDAMSSARVYRRTPTAPPKVLSYMVGKAGTIFDPPLLKHFVACVGIVPIGTLVLLDTNELAVVLRPPPDKEDPHRPAVRLVSDAGGAPVDDGAELDLRETDASGQFLRTIVRLVDNTEYRLDTSRYVAR